MEATTQRIRINVLDKLMERKREMEKAQKGHKEKSISISKTIESVLIENEELKKENENLKELLGGYKA